MLMRDIYKENKLYPYDGKIIDHFKDIYDEVYISFLPFFKVDNYQYHSRDFPSTAEIHENGKAVSWDSVVKGTGLRDFSELNQSLRTSIGALRNVFMRQDLADKLDGFITKQNIWPPEPGDFDMFSKISIYKCFKSLNKNKIIFTDEFYQHSSIINLSDLTAYEFSEEIGCRDCYIYSEDKEILFSIDWYSFFFIIAMDTK